jgi:hypothetical protein
MVLGSCPVDGCHFLLVPQKMRAGRCVPELAQPGAATSGGKVASLTLRP